jgi:hypothetical protein
MTAPPVRVETPVTPSVVLAVIAAAPNVPVKVGDALLTVLPVPVLVVTPVPPLATARVPAKEIAPAVAVAGVNPVEPAEKVVTPEVPETAAVVVWLVMPPLTTATSSVPVRAPAAGRLEILTPAMIGPF